MDAVTESVYIRLCETLDDQIRVYRHLLDVVRKEKDILISANLDDLNENNKTKEAMLLKIKTLEATRIKVASDFSVMLGLSPDQPRLLDMAAQIADPHSEKLRTLHAVLDLLLKRIQEFNRQNETLVQSALNNITGAMKAIRDTLQEKPTYQRKGEIAGATTSGQLVSKEA
jgi:flagellar biosynthesis/type III secretory pathway chaperone